MVSNGGDKIVLSDKMIVKEAHCSYIQINTYNVI